MCQIRITLWEKDMQKPKDLDSGLSSLLGLSRDAILGIRDGVVVFSNPAAVEMLGDNLVGRKSVSLLPGNIWDLEMDNLVCSAELGGRTVSVSVSRFDSFYLLSIPREKPVASVVPMAMLSELRSSVYNLKMAADQIIASYSGTPDPKLNTYASILYHNYYSMLRLTGNLASVNALASGSMTFDPAPTDLGLLCSQLVSSVERFIRDRGVELSFHCTAESVIAPLDRDKIEQLILNLLSNSLLHTSPGDKITLDLKRSGNKLMLAMDDSGTGIPQEQLAYVFSIREKCSPNALSRSGAGAGMGLYIARGIAQLHGGTLIIHSREGRGTSVRVDLPVHGSTSSRFRDTVTEYRTGGMLSILTELSGVLSSAVYTQALMD
jgi:hypothetical protein